MELATEMATNVFSKDDTSQDRTAIAVEDVVVLLDFVCQQQILSATTPTTNRSLVWALLC